ncbi:MAG: electron transport complex subunit RsxC [Rikenellaceae bacterium]|nr:electron transport complex subunit RsxC [Rikenellaceae bacterium]MCL2692241.1 electron transport complex subunit RsxC [Rikenellaceae bacterium]
MSKTFRKGGGHPSDNKLSRADEVERMPLPQTVVIPLSQHIGAPATAVVAKGDRVKVGQLIGEAAGFVSSNVHSSVSGTVLSVDAVPDLGGVRRQAVTIKVEGDEWAEGIDLDGSLRRECTLSPAEIIDKVKEAGVVGMGGAQFPTHVKLSIPQGKRAEYLLINGAECEPYLTSDHRVMLERGEELLAGVKILAKALGVGKSYIGIENNKPDAVAHLRKLAAGDAEVEVIALRARYPQGGEKQLIDAVLGREVPSGGLPIDVGCVVQNVDTALAVYEAVQKNKPLVERVVTVTGKSVERHANLLVRIGTPLQAILDYCGGMPEDTGKVINGGPMMGKAVANLDSVVTKGTSGIVLMRDDEAERRKSGGACIKCAKCVRGCPMGLEPYYLFKLGVRGRLTEMEGYWAADCIECGLCSWVCPANLPLLDYIRLGKVEVMRIMRERKG